MQEILNKPNEVNVLLIIGHNPAIKNLISQLFPSEYISSELMMLRNKYPTGAIAFLELYINDWTQALAASARLTEFVRPNDLTL